MGRQLQPRAYMGGVVLTNRLTSAFWPGMGCGMRGSQALDTPHRLLRAIFGMAPPSCVLFSMGQFHPEVWRVGMGLWVYANVSSCGGREGSPADARGIHVIPPTQALHVHTHGWENFQPKSALLLSYFSPGAASAASSSGS